MDGHNSSSASQRFHTDAVLSVDAEVPSACTDSVAAAAARDSLATGSSSAAMFVEPRNDAVASVGQCSSIQDTIAPVEAVAVCTARNSPGTTSIGPGEKRKRGRPPRGVAPKAPAPKRQREEVVEEEEGEDVCFICFDGGSLVLCDRKGCPKAYHPACIKRDEAFFASAARWDCGWHICSACQKNSHYMCYTCTYSVCKGCTKNADYFRVRRNKGFCSTCMRIVMLIENIDQGNKETAQVDFDDKNNWEYLFKVYWIYLKEKLSLTPRELIQAKNPWKDSEPVHAKRQRLPYALDGNGITGKSVDHLEMKKPKQLQDPPYEDPPSTEIRTISESKNLTMEEGRTSMGTSLNGCIEWASKEFLELVAHMKNGDTSALSNIDVQEVLIEYIKRHNLRDPHQRSQIICDSRLKSLFGKPRVGHIEMLKLLEYHVLIKDEGSQKSAFIPAGIVGTVTSSVEADDDNDISFLNNKAKKRKSNRSSEEKLVQMNLDEYAAIDAHNINLIYLRRDLMGNLIEDMEKFHGRVIGSVVRIRIPSSNQKQEMYRLVHVIGTSKASVPYEIGNKTADVLVEVLNLNKKEVIPIDSISNQDFSEDECRRLRQSIKCGLAKRLTVGEIQKKAMDLRAVKLNDSLEAEILRLNHLRDRASEKGHKKELRECIEKLELLRTPEEHQRRLLTIPEVHADPKMDPNYESEEDARESDNKKQVEYVGHKCTSFDRREDKLMSSWRKAKEGLVMARCKMSQRKEAHGNNILKKLVNHAIACRAVDGSASETSSASRSTLNSTSSKISETEKLWHYRDPCGRLQGPFSVMQLRKWNTSGLFPLDMRIWTNDEHDDAVLLTDALNGLFRKAPRVIAEMSQDFSAASVNSSVASMSGVSSSFPQCLDLNNSYSDKARPSSPVPSSSHRDVHVVPPDGKRCHGIVDFWSGHEVQDSSGSTMPQISDDCNHSIQSNSQGHLGQSSGQNCGSLTSNRSSVYTNSGSSLASVIKSVDFPDLPSPTPRTSYDDAEAQAAEKLLSLRSRIPVCSTNVQDLPSPTPNLEGASVGQATANKESFPSSLPFQNSGRSCSSASSLVIGGAQLPATANEWVSDSTVKPAEAANDHVDTPTSGIPVCSSDVQDSLSPTPKLEDEAPVGQATVNKESFHSSLRVQDSGHSWSSASSRVIGGSQLPETANELVSDSSVKPAEEANDNVDTPTSGIAVCSSDIQDLSSPTPELKDAAPVGQATAKESFPSCLPVQDSGRGWSSASSIMIGGAQLLETVNELISDSSAKPAAEAANDHVDTLTLGIPVCSSDIKDLQSSTPKLKDEAPVVQATAIKESFPSSLPVQDLGCSWSNAPSLVIGGAQLPQTANEWVSDSPVKAAEAANDHVDTPILGIPVCSSDIQDLPSPTPKLKDDSPFGQATPNKESFSSSLPVQALGRSWSSISSLVIGDSQLPETANEWVLDSSVKRAEAVNGHVGMLTSDTEQVDHTSSSHPISNFPDWEAIFGEPIEFSTLDEESVSDLLAEVDAMEPQTQSGMNSPTSAMKWIQEMAPGRKNDYFSFIEELNSTPDPAKSDAFRSTEDIQLTFDPLKRSSGNSSSSSEKTANIFLPQWEAGSNVSAACSKSPKTAGSVVSQSTGLESLTTGNMIWDGPVQGFVLTARENASMNHAGNSVFERR